MNVTITTEQRETFSRLERGSRELARRIFMTGRLHGPCDESALIHYAMPPVAEPSPRQLAIKQGQKTYHGKPCDSCGETLRKVNKAACVTCDRARAEKFAAMRNDLDQNKVLYVQARRKAMALGQTRFHGRPCGTCSGTERYTKNNTCIPCHAEITKRSKGALATNARIELEQIAEHHNVPLKDAMSKSRFKGHVRARHVMWAALRHRGYTLPRIAAIFGCDHTTVWDALNKQKVAE